MNALTLIQATVEPGRVGARAWSRAFISAGLVHQEAIQGHNHVVHGKDVMGNPGRLYTCVQLVERENPYNPSVQVCLGGHWMNTKYLDLAPTSAVLRAEVKLVRDTLVAFADDDWHTVKLDGNQYDVRCVKELSTREPHQASVEELRAAVRREFNV